MSRRFALVTVTLTQVIGFLVGAIIMRVESAADYCRIVRAVHPGDVVPLYLSVPEVSQYPLKTLRAEDR